MQLFERMRKSPKQERSEKTVDAVLEAAALVLQNEGEAAFTTNRIAERAGFGVGTLYQYFPNKESIVAAIARRELVAIEGKVRAVLARSSGNGPQEVIRAVLRVLIRAFSGRRRLRHYVVMSAIRSGNLNALLDAQQSIASILVEALVRNDVTGGPVNRHLSAAREFVLTRAVQGAIRSAVIEENPLLETPEFEDELVNLIGTILNAPPGKP